MAEGARDLRTSVLDVGACDRIGARVEARERRRSVEHAEQLTDLLALRRVHEAAGMGSATAAYAAMLMDASEDRAARLLWEAGVLERLGALDSMRDGLLTVEQARVVVDLLAPVEEALAAGLWQRVEDRLAADRARGVVRPPARLRELLRGWVIAVDPDGYAARRRDAAEADADVELWRRDDGLVDLVGRALSAADAQACRDRIDQLAEPSGPNDTRTLGQRRRQVLVDLVTGRFVLTAGADAAGADDQACCPPGSAAPCGAHIYVQVPLPTAADAADPGAEQARPGAPLVAAELVGHGPIDRDALVDLLAAAPVLHRVWIDANGVPVAVDSQTWHPGRDPDRLRGLLDDLAHGPPPEARSPVHPDDHGTSPPAQPQPDPAPPRVLSRPHSGPAGPYRAGRALTRLLRVRAPRCEWPGCGRRASRTGLPDCDNDHDLPWPYGPTCACQMGPLCRGHHRIKQHGWTKHRNPDGSIRWTAPDGTSWTSPNQHTSRALGGTEPPPQRHRIAPGVWALAA